jgi:hypothetical protein
MCLSPYSRLFDSKHHLKVTSLLSHVQGAFKCLVTTDESSSMDEDTARYAGHLGELLVADTLPGVGQILAVQETAILFADGADAPLAIGLLGLRKENVEHLRGDTFGDRRFLLKRVQMVRPWHALREDQDAPLGVVLEASLVGELDVVAGREPGSGAVGKLDEELVADKGGGLFEAGVFLLLQLLLALGVVVSLGGGVVVAIDHAGDAEPAVLELLGETGGLDGLGVEHVHAVVVGVKRLDEVGVDFLVEDVQVGAAREPRHGGDDVLAKVHVDQAGGGELGRVAGERRGELALVVVEVPCVFIVRSAHVDDGVARLQHVGVARADEGGVGIRRQETEHGDGEGLIGVEVAAGGTGQCWACHHA